eukprot:TRINITY_DN639_c0_g1_i2.p1 TRINITY_DN639_c0_g1~~TRINITY_DN639_c0_g1_i2.p1  ORF type:complete len:282 (-),score=52.01 TRINITY_DN639_c0_g1_i2:471-1316(-)
MSFLTDVGNRKNGGKPELNERLIKPEGDIEKFGQLTASKLEKVQRACRTLEDFVNKIGTQADTKEFRERLRKTIEDGTKDILEVKNLVEQIKAINVTRNNELQNKELLLTRLVTQFNQERDKFSKVVKRIQEKEKVYVETARRSIQGNKGRRLEPDDEMPSYRNGSGGPDVQFRQNVEMTEIAYNEDIINERQQDLNQIGGVIYQLRDLVIDMAAETEMQGQKLDTISNNIASARDKTKDAAKELTIASKHQEDVGKKQIYCCVLLGGFAVLIVLMVMLSK